MKAVIIQKTEDYKLFKFVRGNRIPSKGHLYHLTKSVLKKNLLPYEPILVNENYEVIDGQHRLMVAKSNKLPIYYIIAEGLGLEDVQMLNSNMSVWSARDYMNSYADLGNSHYILLRDLVTMYSLNVGNVLTLITQEDSRKWMLFKKGQFIINDLKQAEEIVLAYAKMKNYVAEKIVFSDRDFVRAIKILIKKVSIEEFIARLNMSGEKIEYHEKVRDYLHQFENIMNYRMRKNTQRLF